MKFILSRKGFDSSWGGYACPIVGDTLVTLPIPVEDTKYADADRTTYHQLRVPGTGQNVLELMRSLGMARLKLSKVRQSLSETTRCHLDPDLTRESIANRAPTWRAALGQGEQAEGHLRLQGVGPGDVFLFFGWFRQSDGAKYVEPAQGRHILFGYLQVGEVIRTYGKNRQEVGSWDHPHFNKDYTHKGNRLRTNAIYVASDRLALEGVSPDRAAWGTFSYRESLVLTKPGAEFRTQWQLPDRIGKVKLSYHGGLKYGWKDGQDYFQSADRGQEFVFDGTPEVVQWFAEDVLGDA